jgi:AcrR family transcriptional regulator
MPMPKIIENVREQLLCEARKQIAERGYAATTIRSVAGACGLGVGTVYNYFESKEMLIASFVYDDWKRYYAEMTEIPCDDPKVLLEGIHRLLKAFAKENEVLFSDEDAAKVYVQDGKVLFARNEKAEGVVLTKGMSATLAAEADVPVMDEKPDANSIAWQRGTFIFDHTPLKDVLDCLSGYYHVSFAATDLSKELSGEFAADDLDLIIELIESALDVTIISR